MSLDNQTLEVGSKLLRDIEILSEARLFYEKELLPTVKKEIDRTIYGWAESNAWIDDREDKKTNSAAKYITGHWVAPNEWMAQPFQGNEKLKDTQKWIGWFKLDFFDNGAPSDLDLARLLGNDAVDIGLLVDYYPMSFANVDIGAANTKFGEELKKYGFDVAYTYKKGRFARKIKIDLDNTILAWESGSWARALQPLVGALEDAKSSVAIFNGIFRAWQHVNKDKFPL